MWLDTQLVIMVKGSKEKIVWSDIQPVNLAKGSKYVKSVWSDIQLLSALNAMKGSRDIEVYSLTAIE